MNFLASLDDEDRAALLAGARRRKLAAGDVLYRLGDPGVDFAVLLSGRVKVVTRSASGRQILIGMRGPGELVGELAVIDSRARGADVVAVDEVEVAVGTGDALRRVLAERPLVLMALCRSVISRLRESDQGRVEMAALTGNARVAVRLLELGERYGRSFEPARSAEVRIELPITQDELADWTGLSRPAVTRALAEFRQAGYVVTGRRTLALTEPEQLRAYVAAAQEG